MTTLNQIRAAVDDGALRSRLTSAAYASGVQSPEAWVSAHIGSLISAPLPNSGQGQSVADVRAYGAGQEAEQQAARDAYLSQAPAVTPASDPSYVTDANLLEAVNSLI